MRIPAPGWRPLAALLAGAGILHLVAPRPFAGIVPAALGDPYPWVYASGVAELACAAALAPARSRRPGALATALLFLVVYPANVQMAADAVASDRASGLYTALTLARLPLQVPLVPWALAVARSARAAHPSGRRPHVEVAP